MKRISARGAIYLCLLGMLSLVLLGCPGKPEPPATDIEPAPMPGDTGDATPPPPATDPNAWKAEIQDVFFDYDKYELRAETRTLLQENARFLKENTGASLVLEGHCDERGTEEYNLALGQRRADAVSEYLADLGIRGSRIQTMSYGEEKPFAMGHDESGWSQNRRVHFRIN